MPAVSSFPLELAQKYDRPGPRYTSYPTAPHFREDFGPLDYEQALQDASGEELSIYVHLPFCRKLCHYCGCHMMVTHRPEKIERYVEHLQREIDLLSDRLSGARRVVQIHWGGGTPTYLDPELIERLSAHLHRRFDVAPDAEISIEADPRGLTEAHLEAARAGGFNRISFGVQDFDPEVQEAIGRVQPLALVEEATERARRLGFESISYDLIYGLPHQTTGRFEETIGETLRLRPDRLSLFSYAHVPQIKKHQRLIETDWLPSPAEKLRIFLMAAERLTVAGYRYIGMDHFALPEDPLCAALDAGTMQRNFQGYSTHAGTTLLGVGLSSISQTPDAYAQNEKGLPGYYAAVNARRLPIYRGYRLNEDDRLRRHVIMELMCTFALDVRAVEKAFAIDFADYFAEALSDLEPLAEDGLIDLAPDRLKVTETGRFFIRNIAMPFDRYLRQKRAQPVHSKTV